MQYTEVRKMGMKETERSVRRRTGDGREIRGRKTERMRGRNERKSGEQEMRELIVKGRRC